MTASKTFVSYSHADDAVARRVTACLRSANIPVWIDDDDILPGQRWDRAIEAAIDECSDFVVLLSNNSVVSDIVLDEVNYALEMKKRVLPVVIEPCKVPMRLKRLEFIRFDADYEASQKRLVDAFADPGARVSTLDEQASSFAYHPGQRHRPSIAVLPFATLNAKESTNVLSDGLLAEIVEALSLNPELFVIASATTREFRDKTPNVDEIGRQLRVSYILFGQLTVLGSRLRVACELVSVGSKQIVWNEHFDRDIADLFAVQDQIARSIVHRLQTGLGTHQRNKLTRKPPQSLNAWEIFQQARTYEWSYQWLSESIALLKRAIELDPSLADAHALLAARMAYMIWYGQLESVAQSLTHADRALVLAPDNANCLVCASVAQQYNGNAQRALGLVERAVEINPNSADAWGYNGLYLASVARNKEALDMLVYAFELSPKDPVRYLWYSHKAICYVNQDNYERALEMFNQSTRLHDQWFWPLMGQAQSHAMLGQGEMARRDWERAKRLNSNLSLASFKFWLRASPLTADQQHNVVKAVERAGCV